MAASLRAKPSLLQAGDYRSTNAESMLIAKLSNGGIWLSRDIQRPQPELRFAPETGHWVLGHPQRSNFPGSHGCWRPELRDLIGDAGRRRDGPWSGHRRRRSGFRLRGGLRDWLAEQVSLTGAEEEAPLPRDRRLCSPVSPSEGSMGKPPPVASSKSGPAGQNTALGPIGGPQR